MGEIYNCTNNGEIYNCTNNGGNIQLSSVFSKPTRNDTIVINISNYCSDKCPIVTNSSEPNSYDKNFGLFWALASVCFVNAIVTLIGNGLVIYVSHQTRNTGRLRHLDGVVKSLAVTDFLFGLIGTPLILINYYAGKLQVLTSLS